MPNKLKITVASIDIETNDPESLRKAMALMGNLIAGVMEPPALPEPPQRKRKQIASEVKPRTEEIEP